MTGRPAGDRSGTWVERRRVALCTDRRNVQHGLMAERYEYKVLELREKMIGGKMSGDKLEHVLNEHAGKVGG